MLFSRKIAENILALLQLEFDAQNQQISNKDYKCCEIQFDGQNE